ncbi:hypothetical protein TH8_13615 [Thalassospira profundimaris]|nr:hypothetical protein TH8_13615 [Thalassospira profundimaris]
MRRIMRNLFIFLPLTLAACASPQYNYIPVSTEVSLPEVGSTTTVGIGDTMLRQGRYVEREAIQVLQSITVGGLGSYTLARGYYVKVGEDKESDFFLPEQTPEGGRVTSGALTDPFEAIQVMKTEDIICGVSIYGGKVCNSNQPFKRIKRPSLEADGFQQTLIYSGKVGNKINIGYREFSNSYARPAFNNDVEYDLSESNLIGYKGSELEVIDATNRNITFKLIRNFNTP